MIDLEFVVRIVLYLIGAGVVFALLVFLLDYAARQFPGEGMNLFVRCAKVFLVIMAVLILIFLVLSILGGKPLFRWGQGV